MCTVHVILYVHDVRKYVHNEIKYCLLKKGNGSHAIYLKMDINKENCVVFRIKTHNEKVTI